jgi:putative methionine-R-sulfoxide reductase with GAF domain
VPIYGGDGVIGIIDAEAFPKNFYSDEKLLQLAKVAYDLGKINLGV